jgi:hypothetical protein
MLELVIPGGKEPYNIILKRGFDWSLPVSLFNPDGTAYDLTDCVLALQAYEKPGYDTPALDLSSDAQVPQIVVDDDPTTGLFSVTLTAEETDAYSVAEARYALTLTDAAGGVWKVLAGLVASTPTYY